MRPYSRPDPLVEGPVVTPEVSGAVNLDLGIDGLRVEAHYEATLRIERGYEAQVDSIKVTVRLECESTGAKIDLSPDAASAMYATDFSGAAMSYAEIAQHEAERHAIETAGDYDDYI